MQKKQKMLNSIDLSNNYLTHNQVNDSNNPNQDSLAYLYQLKNNALINLNIQKALSAFISEQKNEVVKSKNSIKSDIRKLKKNIEQLEAQYNFYQKEEEFVSTVKDMVRSIMVNKGKN